MGQQRVPAARRNTTTAINAGRRGSKGTTTPPSGCDTHSPPREGEERDRGPELGDREQQPRCERQRGGGADAERLLQHQDEQSLPDTDAARREEGQKAS